MPKKYAVEITNLAQRDAFQIRDFIARDKEKAADKWVATFEKKAQSLEMLPFRCEIIPEAIDLDVESAIFFLAITVLFIWWKMIAL